MKPFHGIVIDLQRFWLSQGRVILQPYDTEVGVGASRLATRIPALDSDMLNALLVRPCCRWDCRDDT